MPSAIPCIGAEFSSEGKGDQRKILLGQMQRSTAYLWWPVQWFSEDLLQPE
jgi:hypothetical protein